MSGVRRASSQLLSSRSVHLRIQPRPSNLSESREIFRLLQRFGELSTYKSLRYEYHNPADNVALAIYRDADSAQKALNASPIRFTLERVTNETAGYITDNESFSGERDVTLEDREAPAKDGIEEMLRPSLLMNRPLQAPEPPMGSQAPTTPPPMPFEQSQSPRDTSVKRFQITVDRSRVVHQDYVERQPFWKQFSPMKSLAQEDLAKSVPHIGLSDVSKRPMHQHRTPNKVLKTMSHYVEHHMPTLQKLYEEGGRKQEKE